MSNVSNERWEGDLEADQLDDLAAHEGREDEQPALLNRRTAKGDIPGPGPIEATRDSAERSTGASDERWEGDLEADALGREAAEEGADEQVGGDEDLM